MTIKNRRHCYTITEYFRRKVFRKGENGILAFDQGDIIVFFDKDLDRSERFVIRYDSIMQAVIAGWRGVWINLMNNITEEEVEAWCAMPGGVSAVDLLTGILTGSFSVDSIREGFLKERKDIKIPSSDDNPTWFGDL